MQDVHTQYKFSTKWFDETGLIHDKPINKDGVKTSENGPLFTAVYHALSKSLNDGWGLKAQGTLLLSLSDKYRSYRTNIEGEFVKDHFSFDNMLGFYYILGPKGLPSTWWWSENKKYIRPFESIFFMAVKYKWLMPICLLYLVPAMLVSINRTPEHMGGAQKWFIRCQMLPKWFFRLTTWSLKRTGHNWYNVFYDYYSTYNKNPDDHPIVKAAQERLVNGEF